MSSGKKTSKLELAVKSVADPQKLLACLSHSAGVYIMKDHQGKVIYIGKAKNLKNRVSSYFRGGDGRSQIEYLMRRLHSIETILTETEEQALVLESDLIRKFKPRYNIKLKDDRAFLSVRIDYSQQWPRIELVRRTEEDGAKYIGPFTSGNELRNMLEVIKAALPLRTCSDTIFNNRQRPCLEYQIKRCPGPCCLDVNREEYLYTLKQAEQVLQGKIKNVVVDLRNQMEQASDDMRFEQAAVLRDRITFLEQVVVGKEYVTFGGEHRDVFGWYREGTLGVLAVLFVRDGRIVGNKYFAFEELGSFDQDIVESALIQFYHATREIPEEIILPLDLESVGTLQNYLSNRAGRKVEVVVPQKGVKRRLVGLAQLNARQSFIERFEAEARNSAVSREICRMFALKQVPRRIECVDISNFQGTDIVASVISFFDGQPDKGRYRKYKVSFEGKPNDFQAIYEIVGRHLRRCQQSDDMQSGGLPDLMIIDGGSVQLRMAIKARDELGLDIDMVGLAKERSSHGQTKSHVPERVFLQEAKEAINLVANDPVTILFQRIRDEAHRFAITFHRERRGKRSFASRLTDVPGIGPERAKRLLSHFGSVARITSSSLEDVARIGRMPKTLAAKLLEALRSQ